MLDIFNPQHNLKEICKEFSVLEDHLQLPGQRCPDCIRKHLLKCEKFAEEGIGLDKTGEYLHILRPLPDQIRQIQEDFENGVSDHKIGQAVRVIRKKLVPISFSANLKKRTLKHSLAKNIAELLVPKKDHNQSFFRYLIVAIQKSENKTGLPFIFEARGVSAKRRKNHDWIANQVKTKLQNGSTGRMISQSINGQNNYNVEDWVDVVQSDINGEKSKSIKTLASSVGEATSNKEIKKNALIKATKSGYLPLLREISKLGKSNRWKKVANAYYEIGSNIEDPYFLLKASQIFDKMNASQEEILCFERVLEIEPDHALEFWMNNKIAFLQKNGSINMTSPFVMLPLALGAGILIGVL